MPNPKQYIEDDRAYARAQGDKLNLNAEERARVDRQRWDRMNRFGDEVAFPMAEGRGGYSPAEQDAIMREAELNQSMTRPEEYQQNYLTPEEADAIRGTPWDRSKFFDPNTMMDRQYESAGAQRGAVDEMKEGITPDLALSDDYSGHVDATLGVMDEGVRGAIDPGRIRTSEAALEDIRMSPEEEARMVQAAGATAGNLWRAQVGDYERSGRAAGMDPQGIAAMKERMLRTSSADAADAATRARVEAANARANRAGQAEYMRREGETDYAGMKSAAEFGLGRERVGAAETHEGMRLGAAQDVSNRRMGAADARLEAERGINAQQRQQMQYNAGLGTEIATGVERDTAARNADVAYNRQGTARTNQQQKFQQGATTSGMKSDRAGRVADTRLRDRDIGLDYVQGQQQLSTSREMSEADRQSGLYGQQGQQRGYGTRAAIEYDRRPRTWERAVGAGVAGAAAFIPGMSMAKKILPGGGQGFTDPGWGGG